MSFNNSSSPNDIFFAISDTVDIILLISIIPTVFLYGVCTLALLLAKNINYKMRVLLINIFATQIIGDLLPDAIRYLGFPADIITHVVVCQIIFCLIFIGTLSSLCAITLFSIAVYIFIKYGNTKLKWQFVLPSITLSWIISMVFGASVFIDQGSLFLGEGFICSLRYDSTFYLPALVFTWIFEAALLTVIIVFSILTVCYIHKNTIDQDPQIKRAISRVLLFFLIGSLLNVVGNLFPSLIPLIQRYSGLPEVVYLLLIILEILFFIPQVITPIVMMIILKPLREALRQGQKKLIACLKCKAQSSDETQ